MKIHPKINLLAFAAHPDDVEISAAGIMLKHKAAGLSTGIIDLTAGELGTRGSAEIRRSESAKATALLELDVRENMGFPDGFFSVNPESVLALVRIIRKYRPDIVLINAENDRHPDHGQAHQLLKKALFLSGLIKIKTELEGQEQQAWRPQSVYAYIQDYFVQPDVVLDVTEFWDKRMECLMAYSSQFYDENSNEPDTPISGREFLDNLTGRSHQLGRHIGCRHAEGLVCLRTPGVGLLTDLL